MQLTDEDLARLEAVASRANEGFGWVKEDAFHSDYVYEDCGGGDLVAEAFGTAVGPHVAAFDPPTALALLKEVREWREVQARYPLSSHCTVIGAQI
jgi:hypothetical protein